MEGDRRCTVFTMPILTSTIWFRSAPNEQKYIADFQLTHIRLGVRSPPGSALGIKTRATEGSAASFSRSPFTQPWGRTDHERRRPAGLADHLALIADAALAFVCESLHAGENRIGIEMRFRDHFRFEAAASPAIVEVGSE